MPATAGYPTIYELQTQSHRSDSWSPPCILTISDYSLRYAQVYAQEFKDCACL